MNRTICFGPRCQPAKGGEPGSVQGVQEPVGMGWKKTFARVCCGTADASLRYDDVCQLLARLGFEKQVRDDHHVFIREGVAEILNLQPSGALAKPYQVGQVRDVIVRYRLAGEHEDE